MVAAAVVAADVFAELVALVVDVIEVVEAVVIEAIVVVPAVKAKPDVDGPANEASTGLSQVLLLLCGCEWGRRRSGSRSGSRSAVF